MKLQLLVLPAVLLAAAPARAGADYRGLKAGKSQDHAVREKVRGMKRLLNEWNPKLALTDDGAYDDAVARALALFKAVYGTGRNGAAVDRETAKLLAAREDGTLASVAKAKSAGGAALYAASRFLGMPYGLGADGTSAMDCGLLTKKGLVEAGVVDASFTRAADIQWERAHDKNGRFIAYKPGAAAPRPGDLVFWRHTYDPGVPIYDGVTHVGFFVGEAGMKADDALVLDAGGSGVALRRLAELPYEIAGYARPR